MWWAEKFQWTPEQVDGINAERAMRLRHAADAIDVGREKAAEAEQSKVVPKR